MFRIILVTISVIICWRWGDWRNWQKYYPTILYFILLDFLNNMLFANYSLWEYRHLFPNHTLNDIFDALTIFPCTALVFLPHFPNKFNKQILYVLFWVVVYSVAEYISLTLGCFKHFNGWNIWCSAVFNVALFLTLIMHHKKTEITWVLTAVGIIIVVVLTKLPLNSINEL